MMDINLLLKDIDEASILMYQNNENKAIEAMETIFPQIKGIADDIIKAIDDDQVNMFLISTVRELLDGYKNGDMINMADCLQEKVPLILKLYEGIESGNK